MGDNRYESKLPEKIGICGVKGVVAQAFGITGGSTVQSDIVKDDMFNRPSLNYLVVVNGLGSDSVEAHDLTNIRALLGNNKNLKLDDLSYPRDPVALAATLATGHKPREHGIIGEHWSMEGNAQRAFEGNHALVANIADLVTKHFGEDSLAISVSGSKAESLAYAPHQANKNSFTYHFDAVAGKFVPAAGTPMSHSEIGWSLAETVANGNGNNNELWSRIKLNGGDAFFNREEDMFTVKSGPSASEVHFDMKDPVDSTLLAELCYSKFLTNKLATSTKLQKKLTDSSPDTITISFHSLNAIGEKYGFNSKEFISALHLFDSALPLITHNLQTLTPSSSMGQVVLMGSPVNVNGDLLDEQMKHLSLVSLRKFLPSVYLKHSPEATSDSCQVLRMNVEMASPSLKTYCPTTNMPRLAQINLLSVSATATNETATDDEIMKFQIALWMSLALGFSLLAGVLTFVCMEYDRDTMLFSKRRIKDPSKQ